jgi:methionyl-tRNA formyltransferase
VALLGTAYFAVPILRAIEADPRFEVALVVTQPDRPHGRGRSVTPGPVAAVAIELGLPLVQPEAVRSARFRDALCAVGPDFLVVAAYGRILPQAVLDVPHVAPVNVHGSLLPSYRGAAPVQRALMDGCATTGVTTIVMNAEMDAGDILLARSVPIRPDHNAETLMAELAQVGSELAVETLVGMLAGTVAPVPQDHARATLAPPLGPDDAALQWSHAARDLWNRIRAMAPRPGAYTVYDGRRLKVLRADYGPLVGELPHGQVLSLSPQGVCIATGMGCLTLIEVQPEGKRPMGALDWARGARVTAGARLS